MSISVYFAFVFSVFASKIFAKFTVYSLFQKQCHVYAYTLQNMSSFGLLLTVLSYFFYPGEKILLPFLKILILIELINFCEFVIFIVVAVLFFYTVPFVIKCFKKSPWLVV